MGVSFATLRWTSREILLFFSISPNPVQRGQIVALSLIPLRLNEFGRFGAE